MIPSPSALGNAPDTCVRNLGRDTGEVIIDMSVPITLGERHWGAIRLGFNSALLME